MFNPDDKVENVNVTIYQSDVTSTTNLMIFTLLHYMRKKHNCNIRFTVNHDSYATYRAPLTFYGFNENINVTDVEETSNVIILDLDGTEYRIPYSKSSDYFTQQGYESLNFSFLHFLNEDGKFNIAKCAKPFDMNFMCNYLVNVVDDIKIVNGIVGTPRFNQELYDKFYNMPLCNIMKEIAIQKSIFIKDPSYDMCIAIAKALHDRSIIINEKMYGPV